MANKNFNTRIINKHDTEENWSKANFIPKQGELIIYDIDSTHDIERFKIGDGTTTVNNLPFRSIDGGYDALTEIVPETTLNFDSPQLNLDCPPIEVGKEYTVTFYHPNSDNTEYKLVGRNDSSGLGFTCIGNETYTWGGDIDTTTPFLIYTTSSSNTNIRISSSETFPCTYNIKIKAIIPIKINEKYLDIKNTNIVDGSAKGSLRTIGSSEEGSGYEIGSYAFAEGVNTKASGYKSHAEGGSTTASGECSHAQGDNTKASGFASHTEGEYATASGEASHAEGANTIASGGASHAEGDSTAALGDYSHAEGSNTVAGQMGFRVTACEKSTGKTGTYTLTSVTGLSTYQRYSVHLSSSKEDCGRIIAIDTTNKKITVDGYPDIALSSSSSSNYLTIVNSPKLGDRKVSGNCSHAEGDSTTALGNSSHAEGANTKASGYGSHAEGNGAQALGDSSHAEGSDTIVYGNYSHAEGSYITVSGNYSHAEGYDTTASSDYQHVQGKNNIHDSNNIYADIIGNGDIDLGTHSNAYTLDWNGNGWFSGNVYVGSTSGTNKDEGSKKLATEEYVNSAISSGGGSGIVVDAELSSTSVNPVQNKVINTALSNKMDKSNPSGTGSFSLNRMADTTVGYYSFAEGYNTTASNY